MLTMDFDAITGEIVETDVSIEFAGSVFTITNFGSFPTGVTASTTLTEGGK